jgi:hypothetical protein
MKKITLSFLIIPALLIIGLNTGCYYDDVILDPQEYTEDPNGGGSGEEVLFSRDVLSIFDASCNFSGCHNTGGTAPDLSSNNAYNALVNGGYIDTTNPKQSSLYEWVNGGGSSPMPLSGTDQSIVSDILTWIQQGALNN